jgi:two-component system OmpR family response regulator
VTRSMMFLQSSGRPARAGSGERMTPGLDLTTGAPGPALVMVVEDEANIAFVVAAALRLSGLEVIEAGTGRDALGLLQSGPYPDLVILDVMLPDLDGFEVCKRIRADFGDVPVAFVTARDSVDDRVRGLTLGADDYLVKPFDMDELLARVRAILRRCGKGLGSAVFVCGDLTLDDQAHLVTRDDREVALSPTEYRLLRFLMWNIGRVVSREDILDGVWGYGFDSDSTVVETFVSSLRKKVDRGSSPLIRTVRGFGYQLATPDDR